MNVIQQPNEIRKHKSIDTKSQKNYNLLPYLKSNKKHTQNARFKSKFSSSPKSTNETHILRYDEANALTVLSVRFASSQSHTRGLSGQQIYIKNNKKAVKDQKKQQTQQQYKLPFLRYKKSQSPEQHLKQLGYNPDIRLASEIYLDKVQQRKNKYLNRMQALKRQLGNFSDNQRHYRMQKGRIQIRILDEEIKRKRQRELIMKQQRIGKKMLHSLLNQPSQ